MTLMLVIGYMYREAWSVRLILKIDDIVEFRVVHSEQIDQVLPELLGHRTFP